MEMNIKDYENLPDGLDPLTVWEHTRIALIESEGGGTSALPSVNFTSSRTINGTPLKFPHQVFAISYKVGFMSIGSIRISSLNPFC